MMFQGNVHEFLDKILEELKKNRDLVIEQDGESVTVRHRGDPDFVSGHKITILEDKWLHIEWVKYVDDWIDYDPTKPDISLKRVLEKIGDCTECMPKWKRDPGYMLMGKDTEHCLVEYSEEQYEEYRKKLMDADAERGVRSPNIQVPELYNHVLVSELVEDEHTKYTKTFKVFYYYCRWSLDGKIIYMNGRNFTEDFKECEMFENPDWLYRMVYDRFFHGSMEYSYIDFQNNVYMYKVPVYKRCIVQPGLLKRIRKFLLGF